MTDHFAAKASDWDSGEARVRLADAVSTRILERVAPGPSWHVLDFGAGTGLVSERLVSHVGRITAVDTSPSMLERLATKEALADSVEPMCRDLLEEPLDRTFDLVVTSMAAHHVEDTTLLLRRFADHVRPGGHLALADLDSEAGDFHEPGTEGVHHHGFDRDELRRRLEAAGFAEVSFETVHEMERPTGRYPVFLVTAVRS